jgi:uncharacterized protein
MKITGIYIYPIKSLGGISLESSKITERGLELDRRWALVDENLKFLSQREIPEMAKFSVKLADNEIIVTNTLNGNSIKIPLKTNSLVSKKITIWDDSVEALHVGDNYDFWFSENLGVKCKLFYQPEDSIRAIDSKYMVLGNEHTSLSDGYPILIAGEKSLEMLNNKCPEKIEMRRFRPNLVFEGGLPFCEDNFKKIKLGSTQLFGVKPCARCVVTTINPESLQKTKEPLLTLSKFRKNGHKILFGHNLVVHEQGSIKLGDEIKFED